MSTIEVQIPLPDDWHVHLRDDEMLAAVAGYSAERFGRSLIMPNLTPPIVTWDAASSYRDRIIGAVDNAPASFEPLMSLYLTPAISTDDLRIGAESGQLGGVKFYPAGATTNSDAGGTSLGDFDPILEAMVELGIPLLIHAESTDPALDIFDREAAFLELEVAPLLDRMPGLSVTVEHISTANGIELVKAHPQAYGSITPHHLSCDRSDLLANGMRPELYCKPVINSATNREALVAAATSGDEKFFLGTDSAPHPLSAKEARVVKAGIFNAPCALEVTAEVFHQADALDAFGAFCSTNGAARYGRPVADAEILMTRDGTAASTDQLPDTIVNSKGETVRLFGVGEAALWTIQAVGA